MSFNTSLKFGEIGEAIFHQAHELTIGKHPGRDGDFFELATGEKVELKTDYWSMDDTPNFFFERFSDYGKQSPGGPWQAIGHGCTHFVYFYLKNLTVFRFDTATLVAALEPLLPTLKPFPIRNKTYTTVGYRVPRELLKDIYIEEKLEVSRGSNKASVS